MSLPMSCHIPSLMKPSGESSVESVLPQGLHSDLHLWDFRAGPVAKTLPSNAEDLGSIPGQ